MCPGVLRHLQPLCTVCVWSETATGSEAQAGDVTPQLGPLGCPPTIPQLHRPCGTLREEGWWGDWE